MYFDGEVLFGGLFCEICSGYSLGFGFELEWDVYFDLFDDSDKFDIKKIDVVVFLIKLFFFKNYDFFRRCE